MASMSYDQRNKRWLIQFRAPMGKRKSGTMKATTAGIRAKAWKNMRARRANELENEFGAHKATEWCGHTEKIAKAHYWMVTPNAVSEAAGFVSDAHVMPNRPDQRNQ